MFNLAFVVASATLILTQAVAQQGAGQASQAKLVALRDAKLNSAFLKRTPWTTDFAVAKAAARKRGVPILVYFTRSYAPSPPCTAIENDLFSSAGFVKLAARVVLFCHITSRVKTDANQDLLARVGGDSFPHMIFADAAGRRIATVGRISSVEDITTVLDGAVRAFFDLRSRAAKGDKKAKAAYLMVRLRLGHLDPEQIEKELATADYLTAEQVAALRHSLASLEVMAVLASIDEKNPKSLQRATDRILVMMRAGRVPSGQMAFPFWQVLLGHADETEDPDLFGKALGNIKKLKVENRDEKWLTRMELRLRALQFMKGRKNGGKKDGE